MPNVVDKAITDLESAQIIQDEDLFVVEQDDTAKSVSGALIKQYASGSGIETVKVNGTALTPDANRAVNVPVPTKTSDLDNDSNFISDASYVHTDNNYTTAEKTKLSGIETGAEVNTIETVKVNGTALTPDADKAVNIVVSVDPSDVPIATVKVNGTALVPDADKAVNVIVPTKTSDLTNDSGFQTAAQVASAVAGEAALREAADAEMKHIAETAFVKRVSSGDVAAFDDGADQVPVADLTVELPYKSAGYTGCTVTQTGKNLVDIANQSNIAVGTLRSNTLAAFSAIRYEENTQYTISFDLADVVESDSREFGVVVMYVGYETPQYLWFYEDGGVSASSRTTDAGKTVSSLAFGYDESADFSLSISNVMVERGSAKTDYVPYVGQTYAADWTDLAGTIYGGTWDVTSGVLTSTLDENGDALAQPVTYDLDPIAVKTVLGNNFIWSDAGAVSVTYRADPNMVIYNSTSGGFTSWKALQNLVRLGRAKEVLSVGDQLVCRRNGVDLVWDVLGIDCDTPADPQFTHSVTIGLHDCLQDDLQFDVREALFYFENGLAAGTYNFTVKARTDVSSDVNKTFQFTLTQAIPAKGQLVLDVAYNVTIANSTAKTYSGADSATAIETVTITEGSSGTSLGDVNNAISGGTNSLQRVLLGNNNYFQSVLRQYLNSKGAAASVWSAKNVWDRPLAWTTGFLNGMDEDFLSVVGEVTKKTALNTVSDGGGVETTVEKFFMLSRSEVYGGDVVTGGEGADYPYYSEYSSLGSAGTGNDSNRIKYRNGTAKSWWLRSPYTSSASNVYCVYTTGNINNYNFAYASRGCAPACCIV